MGQERANDTGENEGASQNKKLKCFGWKVYLQNIGKWENTGGILE